MNKKKCEFYHTTDMKILNGPFTNKKMAIQDYADNYDADIQFTILQVVGVFITEYPQVEIKEID